MPAITRSKSKKPVENTESLEMLCYIATMDETTLEEFKKFIIKPDLNSFKMDEIKAAFENRVLEKESYNGFVILGQLMRSRVDDFLKWLNETVYSENDKSIEAYPIIDVNVDELEKVLKSLYRQKFMWKLLKKYGIKSSLVHGWWEQVRNTFVHIVRYHLYTLEQLGDEKTKREYYRDNILRLQIKYYKCYTKKYFVFGVYQRFLKSIIKKSMEMLSDGIPEAMLLLKLLVPNIVCDECYPTINRDNLVYKQTDFNKLESVREFTKLYNQCRQYM